VGRPGDESRDAPLVAAAKVRTYNPGMRALVQRVASASVSIDADTIARIERGFLVFVGVTHGDSRTDAGRLAARTARLRIFEDGAGLMNLALGDVGGRVLAVSQFTLYADTRRGNRPSFTDAAAAGPGEEIYEAYVAALRDEGLAVETGVFGARMRVELVNDGPVTVMLEEPR
jgi:D-aminoacyl-tRNA deacylase